VDGRMTLRRGFELHPADRVLVVEDIVSTGGSVRELLALVQAEGAQVQQVACLVDRSADGLKLAPPTKTLLRLPIASWTPRECPQCLEGLPLAQPGRTGK
jgi:orotate phosphoribosyltransferase